MAIYSIGFTFLIANRLTSMNNTAQMIQSPHWVWLAVTVFIGILCLMFGYMGIYSKIFDKTKSIGLVGFILIEIAYLLQAAKVTWEIFLYPVIMGNPISAFLLADGVLKHSGPVGIYKDIASLTILIGISLFCWAITRSKQFPKASGYLVFFGAVLYGISPMLNFYYGLSGIFIFAAGCFLLGKTLITGKR